MTVSNSNSSIPNQGYKITTETRVKVARKQAEYELDTLDATIQEVSKRYPDMEDNLIVQIALYIHSIGQK